MTWFRVDDGFAFHPKAVAASNATLGLWVRAGSWSSFHLTGGFIPETIVTGLGGRKADIEHLTIEKGLWEPVAGGFLFHDWKDYNPDATAIDSLRNTRSEAARFGNHRRWHTKRGGSDPDCPYCDTT